jgi:hypothetical protein
VDRLTGGFASSLLAVLQLVSDYFACNFMDSLAGGLTGSFGLKFSIFIPA